MIKVAVIGAGAIANTHIESFMKFKDRCQIVALADIYPEKAQEKAEKYGLQASVYADYRKLLNEQPFDLASVCTPPFAHAQAAVDTLNAGRHVLVEKPMATSLEECDAMIDAAVKNDRLLSVVAQNRFKTPMMKIKRVLESGLLGRIVHAQVDSYWWRGQNYYDLWWRGTWEKEGGGCTMNHAVHHIDLFQWMMGMPDQLQAVMTNLAHDNSEVEDFSTAVLMYQDGSLGQITASLVHHGERQRLVFQGARASVSVPWQVTASTPRDNGFPQENPLLEAQLNKLFASLPDLQYEGHDGQVDNVLSAIAGEQDLLIDGAEGRKTLELVMAIYQSGTSGKRVALPLAPQDDFYTRQGVMQAAPHFHEKTRSVEGYGSEEITLGSDYEARKK